MATHRDIISKHMVTLCDLSSISVRLITKCGETDDKGHNILNPDEIDTIESEKLVYSRNRAFYDILKRKDGDTFQKMINIMEQTNTKQSEDVLKILRQVSSPAGSGGENLNQAKASSSYSTRRLKKGDPHWIIKHFLDDSGIADQKEIFYNELGLNHAHLSEIKLALQMAGSINYNFFFKCFTKWMSEFPEDATFANLDTILRNLKLNDLADTIAQDMKINPKE